MCQMNTGALISFRHNWAPASIVYTDRLYEQEGCVAQWLGCSGRVRGEMLHSGSRGCPIINPLPVAPTVQMVPGAHMASNPVVGILLSELPPTLSLLPPRRVTPLHWSMVQNQKGIWLTRALVLFIYV